MKLTDEARAAGLAALHGDSEWHKSDGAGVWRANYGRAVDLVLAAALPHLTDDGAAAPAVTLSSAAEATSTAAPSSPHLEAAMETVLLTHMRNWNEDGTVTCKGCGYVDDQPGGWIRHQSVVAAGLFLETAQFELETERISWHRKEGYEAGLAARGATPAIDRDVLTAALGWVDNALRNGSAMTRANLAFEVLCRQLGVDRDSLNTSDAAIERLRTALTGGAQ